MIIETKRNINDWVWFMQENKVQHGYIASLKTMTGNDGNTVEYYNVETGGKPESKNILIVFDTKQDLLNSL